MTKREKSAAEVVRARIVAGGERLWRFEDFADLPFVAVAHALSRLTKEGVVQRLSKGTYFRARETAFGKSRPNPAAVQRLAGRSRTVFPAGVAAANLLGFTSQTAARAEVATSSGSLPRKLVGPDTVIHARRPAAWVRLSDRDAALLDFLRRAGQTSELAPEDTIRRTLDLLAEGGRFERVLAVADTEPPRTRALLGALGAQLGKRARTLDRLWASLNPLTRFNFGAFAGLPTARAWHAKGASK